MFRISERSGSTSANQGGRDCVGREDSGGRPRGVGADDPVESAVRGVHSEPIDWTWDVAGRSRAGISARPDVSRRAIQARVRDEVQQGVNVGLLQQLASDGLPGSSSA
jgi:hypothetical protein